MNEVKRWKQNLIFCNYLFATKIINKNSNFKLRRRRNFPQTKIPGTWKCRPFSRLSVHHSAKGVGFRLRKMSWIAFSWALQIRLVADRLLQEPWCTRWGKGLMDDNVETGWNRWPWESELSARRLRGVEGIKCCRYSQLEQNSLSLRYEDDILGSVLPGTKH